MIIAFVSQKGGTGKTTLSRVAAEIAKQGRKVFAHRRRQAGKRQHVGELAGTFQVVSMARETWPATP